MEWKQSGSCLSSGIFGYQGKICLFNIFWSSTGYQEKPFKIDQYLPGLKPKDEFLHFPTEEEAIQGAENLLAYWLKKADLRLKFQRMT